MRQAMGYWYQKIALATLWVGRPHLLSTWLDCRGLGWGNKGRIGEGFGLPVKGSTPGCLRVPLV
jgi:hypothetical protein